MKLTLQIHSAKALVLAEFSKGKLRKVTLKKGNLTAKQWLKIGKILPPTENDIEAFKQHLNGVVTYTPLLGKEAEDKDLYKKFISVWFTFYERFTGVSPRFNATEGKCLKEIIAYFQSVCQTDDEALQTWEFLLGSWQNLDAFHQKNTDLKYINSNINKIIQNAKRQTSGAATTKYSDSFKRKIFEALQSK